MTTTQLRPPAPPSSTSAPDLMGDLRYAQTTAATQITIPVATTEGEESHRQLMRELAALSFDPNSLQRGLEDEINRNAWGPSGE
jgi:hypothetical protein